MVCKRVWKVEGRVFMAPPTRTRSDIGCSNP